ncbi:cupin domain-containing protein [Roseomonas fluvialis]|uniref:Cupin type-2 domain-containing protein n=1 Tax=Roseomonas fluvialis TaxID=1750527 RepID=A0ABN6P322_9PROT|nr:cupin domain-containing protein [Roseomonas fluvialis]BDG73004.1 hypothetical protein Rmf_29330 [Roseomonas fluvialis]
MDTAAFEAALRAEGFADVATKFVPHAPPTPEHSHPFDVRALVLEGEVTLICAGESRRYGPGEVFAMAQGRAHAEAVGPAGVRYLVGRRAAG